MSPSEAQSVENAKIQLVEMLKPFQQEQNQRQKKSEFVKKCIQCVEKNDFFQLDELLKSKQAVDVQEDSNFEGSESIFGDLRNFADKQIDYYRLKYNENFIQMAEQMGLPLKIESNRFSVLKGIEGKLNFTNRSAEINGITIKSIDPKRIISTSLRIKKQLYDSVFEPQKFINSLLECYKEILKKESLRAGDVVSIWQLYTDYVWSLQSKVFFQNMDKGKFKGYSIDQFAVDLWRFFESDVSATEHGYRIKLNSGRGKTLWLIDQDGERRQISHASFLKH